MLLCWDFIIGKTSVNSYREKDGEGNSQEFSRNPEPGEGEPRELLGDVGM